MASLKPSSIVKRAVGPAAGKAILAAVNHAAEARWEAAIVAAEATEGTRRDRVAQIERQYRRELTAIGAATGAASAFPGAGFLTLASTTMAELTWSTVRTAELVQGIAVIHGLERATVEQRRGWILALLAFDDAASGHVARIAGELGGASGVPVAGRVPADVLQRLNQVLGRALLAKYGTTRGAIALGRALPLGIGAAIGGGANNVMTRLVARRADAFFAELPSVLADDVIDVDEVSERDGRSLPRPRAR